MILRLGALVVCSVLLSGCAVFIPDSVLEDRVREVVQENPDIVIDALAEDPIALLQVAEKGVKARHALQAEQRFRDSLAAPLSPVVDDSRVMRGAADAPVTVVGYTHFLCSYCAHGAKDMKELLARRDGEMRYVVKHAPTSEAGELGALLFEALARQGHDKAWAFYDAAFAGQQDVLSSASPGDTLKALAAGLDGVDVGRLEADLQDDALRDLITSDLMEFQNFGFRGVPVYLFNGVPVEGSMSLAFFEKAVDIVKDVVKASGPTSQ